MKDHVTFGGARASNVRLFFKRASDAANLRRFFPSPACGEAAEIGRGRFASVPTPALAKGEVGAVQYFMMSNS
jgi:hypothetical protein